MRRTRETIDLDIAGIPCKVDFEVVPATRGARATEKINGRLVKGRPIEPDEPRHINIIEIRDRKGYPAPWLARKLKNSRVEQAFIDRLTDELDETCAVDTGI